MRMHAFSFNSQTNATDEMYAHFQLFSDDEDDVDGNGIDDDQDDNDDDQNECLGSP